MLAALEDHVVQNPFTAIGHLKPSSSGASRRVILFYLDYGDAARIQPRRPLGREDDPLRALGLHRRQAAHVLPSNYDGSLESYMDDFIDKVAWGLNLVFSNGVGYPRTSWLVRGGAKDELAFKDYLRTHQIPTRVWYSAYDRLTALNVQQNESIRSGLRGGDDAKWVQSL
jgi:hypothetical protein